jgi:hypothetical protein
MKNALMWVMLFAAPGAMASNCDNASNEAQELQNGPAQEMQDYRATTKPNACVTANELMARPKKGKATAGGGATKKNPPAPAPSTGAYVPKTKDDNTPYRFDMNQNGKKMTAEEFDAWMKAKGIHVATGKPGGPAVAAEPVVTPSTEPACKPTKRKKC